MTDTDSLLLHEEALLLALRDKEGTIAPGAMYQHAIAGAIMAELLMRGRVEIEESRKRKLVNLVTPKSVGDPLLDECLEKIHSAKRRATLQTWISRFSGVKNLKHRVAERLCRRGILRSEEGRLLLIFSRRIYPEANPKPERELIKRLRRAIFTAVKSVDPRTVVLVSLANGTGLLRVIFDKRELRDRRARIEQIINGELTGKATQEAIAAMQAAVTTVAVCCAASTTMGFQ